MLMRRVISITCCYFQCTYKRNGLTLITHEKQEDGQVVVYERELKGDEMHVVRISYTTF